VQTRTGDIRPCIFGKPQGHSLDEMVSNSVGNISEELKMQWHGHHFLQLSLDVFLKYIAVNHLSDVWRREESSCKGASRLAEWNNQVHLNTLYMLYYDKSCHTIPCYTLPCHVRSCHAMRRMQCTWRHHRSVGVPLAKRFLISFFCCGTSRRPRHCLLNL